MTLVLRLNKGNKCFLDIWNTHENLGHYSVQIHRNIFKRRNWFCIISTFKMRINTMGVPLKLTSYPLETLLSGGVFNSKIYQQVPDHMLGHYGKAYLSIFSKQICKRGGGIFGHYVYYVGMF